MFESLPGPGAFLFFGAFLASVALTVLGIALKLAGALLLSWWWIAAPVPALIVVSLMLGGIGAVFGR